MEFLWCVCYTWVLLFATPTQNNKLTNYTHRFLVEKSSDFTSKEWWQTSGTLLVKHGVLQPANGECDRPSSQETVIYPARWDFYRQQRANNQENDDEISWEKAWWFNQQRGSIQPKGNHQENLKQTKEGKHRKANNKCWNLTNTIGLSASTCIFSATRIGQFHTVPASQ